MPGTEITRERALELLNEGGWQILGGLMVEDCVPYAHVAQAWTLFEQLKLSDGTDSVGSMNLAELTITLIDETRPRKMAFMGPYTSKRPHKLKDPQRTRTQLFLLKVDAQAQHVAERASRRMLNREERKQERVAAKAAIVAECAAAKKREEDARAAVITDFFAYQLQQIGDAHPVAMAQDPGRSSFTITFSNGYKLRTHGSTYTTYVEGGGKQLWLAPK